MPKVEELLRSANRIIRVGAKVLLAGLLLVTLTSGVVLAASSNGNTNQGTQKGITVQASPNGRSVTQGTSASYNVIVQPSGGFTGTVSLSASGLPVGATASFSPAAVAVGPGAASATLTVSTSSATPLGTYTVGLKGNSGPVQSAVDISLTVTAGQHALFSISGSPAKLLAPGYGSSIDLQLANPGNSNMGITGLTVSVAGITRTADSVLNNRPCSPSDYAVTQFSGSYPFTVPPGTSSLSTLHIPETQWPQIRMLNSPLNQDGCKGATVKLSYSGTAQGN
ncbi:hypothetical protein GCM10027405_18650 [Arthrobacter alkaliphilus]|uniref:COG1470 family protein n=1 Tax=Arthrobacter alkaliphilus TaxID=369936 RepID=UPI001F1DCE45|nr:hypothetical protein [Arthrobacter alkaliphilus]